MLKLEGRLPERIHSPNSLIGFGVSNTEYVSIDKAIGLSLDVPSLPSPLWKEISYPIHNLTRIECSPWCFKMFQAD